MFDLDDTLIDWRICESKAIAMVAETDLGHHLLDDVRRLYDKVWEENRASYRATGKWWFLEDRLKRLKQLLGDEGADVSKMQTTFSQTIRDTLHFMDGAAEVLGLARSRGPVAILTNGPSHVQRPKIDILELESLVDEVCVAGELELWKPDPAAFLETCKRIDVAPNDVTMVGDSLLFDIQPAAKLGMQTVWVQTHGPTGWNEGPGHDPDVPEDTIIVDHVSKLLG